MIQNESEKLKVQENLAKANARIQAFSKIDLESGNERQELQPKPLEDSYWRGLIRTGDASRVAKVE